MDRISLKSFDKIEIQFLKTKTLIDANLNSSPWQSIEIPKINMNNEPLSR